MNHVHRAAWDIKLKAGNYMEGGLKRLGALFLKFWAVPMVPVGVGLMLYGLITKLESGYNLEDTFPVGVALTIFGALLWFLAKRLEAAADADLTVEEAEEILKRLADGGYVEMEVTDSGLMVYRFPEILYGHEKPWSRGIESA